MYQTKHLTTTTNNMSRSSSKEYTIANVSTVKAEDTNFSPIPLLQLSNVFSNDNNVDADENVKEDVLKETNIKVEITAFNETDVQGTAIKMITAEEMDVQEHKKKIDIISGAINDGYVRKNDSIIAIVRDNFITDTEKQTQNMKIAGVKSEKIVFCGKKPYHLGCESKCHESNSMLSHVEVHCDETDLCTDKLQKTVESNLQSNTLYDNIEKHYSCSYCDYKSSHKSSVVYHERIHTGEKPYVCKDCDYRSTTNANLIKHSKQHTGEKQYACTYCEYRSNYKVDLTRHSRIHTGEKPYECDYCDYRSNDKGHLAKHSRRHTGEKPYECKHCDYRSASKTSLIVHNRQHTGEKPYACDYCDYRGVNKSHLDRHNRCHTGEKPYACSDCNYRSSDRANLMRHIRRRGHLTTQDVK